MNGSLLALISLLFFFFPKNIQIWTARVLIALFYIFIYIDFHYVQQFGTHLPFSTLEYLDEAGNFATTIQTIVLSPSTLYLLILPITAFFFIIQFWSRLSSVKTGPKGFVISFLVLLVLGGSAGAYSNSYVSKNFNDPLTSAGANYFFWSKRLEKAVTVSKPTDALKVVTANLPGHKIDELTTESFPLIRLSDANTCLEPDNQTQLGKILCRNQKEKLNILIILLESFRAADMGVYGSPLNLSPEFDKWSKKGILFKNFYANGFQTRHGQVAAYCSLMPNNGVAIMKRYYTNRFFCLPEMLKQEGYSTSMVFGSDLAFDNQNKFFPTIGFDHFIDQFDFPTGTETLGWGISDQAFFKKWDNFLQTQKQPFFSSGLTITNHHPYTVPEEFKLGKGNDDQHRYFEALRYSDFQLGKFLTQISNTDWFQNSLVFVLADHSNYQKPYIEPETFEGFIRQRAQIPMMILGGAVKTPAVIHEYASQIDLAPTIMDLKGKPYKGHFAGRSLLRQTDKPYAYTMRPGNYWAVMSEKVRYYNEANRKDHIYGNSDLKEAESMKQLGSAWLKVNQWLLQEDLFWEKTLNSK